MIVHQSLGRIGGTSAGHWGLHAILQSQQDCCFLFPEDVGTTTHPVLARLAATSGNNDARDFWNVFDIPVVSLLEIDAVAKFWF